MTTNFISNEARDLAFKRLAAMTEAEINQLAVQQRDEENRAEGARRIEEQNRGERELGDAVVRHYEAAEEKAIAAWVAFAEAIVEMYKSHNAEHLDARSRDLVVRRLPDPHFRVANLRGRLLTATPRAPQVEDALFKMFGIRHLQFGV